MSIHKMKKNIKKMKKCIKKMKKCIKKMKKGIDRMKKLMYYISMKTIKNLLETFEKNKKTISIFEIWIFDGNKKPSKKWFFKKEEEVRIKDSADNIVTLENLIDYREYKSKQAAKKRYKKEKEIMEVKQY